MRLTTKGLYYDAAPEDYFADPCPEPSLSRSGIQLLLEATPAHFAAAHPRLTQWPDQQRKQSAEMTLGSVVHKLLLGRGAEIWVAPYDNWRTKEAQERRKDLESKGVLCVLQHVYHQAEEIARRARRGLEVKFGRWPIGGSEVTMLWQRKAPSGRLIWCRALADHINADAGLIVDLKTTSKPLGDNDLARKFASDADDLQAAWYTEGLETIRPDLAGKVRFVFAAVEVEPPYLVRCVELERNWIAMAQQRIDVAAERFAKCLDADEWPGWSGHDALAAPSWQTSKWMTELEGEA